MTRSEGRPRRGRTKDPVPSERDTGDGLLAALEAADIGTWDLDPASGVLVWSNRARELFGVPGDATISLDAFYARLHEDDRASVREAIGRALDPAGDGRFAVEFRVPVQGGAPRWLLSKGRAYFAGERGARRAVRFLGTVLDTTERRAAEDALRASEAREQRARQEAEKANKAKSEFLATMSHELRTPLTAIIGYEELLADGMSGPVTDEQMRQLRRIKSSAYHLLTLIDEVLTFSRVEAGRERVRNEPVDVTEMLDDAEMIVAPLAAERDFAFVVRRPPERVVVETDPGKLRQILLNLLSNAVKFTTTGEVALEAMRVGESVQFVVRDTGIGIAAEHQERVFEPFWQVEQKMTRSAGGTGLGLSVSRQLARLLGGDLRLTSALGAGSTFVLTLPLRGEEMDAENEE